MTTTTTDLPSLIDKVFSFVLGTSWRTSLIGIWGLVLTTIIPYLQDGKWPTTEQFSLALILAIALRFTKDHNVTGGSKQ